MNIGDVCTETRENTSLVELRHLRSEAFDQPMITCELL